jgi:zinc/manganese transport system substrate-binding protein
VARALTERLSQLDPKNASYYAQRGSDFQSRWQAAMTRWNKDGAALKGVPVVVIHRDQAYLCNWLGLRELAAIEPKPGIPPTAGYLGELVTRLSAAPPKMILKNAYNDGKAVNWLSGRIHAPVVELPYSVGGSPEAKDLFGLYDDTLRRLRAAVQ